MSLLALFLSLWLATMPVAFMFSMGCCCGSTACTGAGDEGDCCLSTLPTQLDVTIPNDFSNRSPVVCNACASIAGTYTLTGSSPELFCSGSVGGADNDWSYRTNSFCNSTSIFCGTQAADLVISAHLQCDGDGRCRISAAVTLTVPAASECCCVFSWGYVTDFDPGTDCDTEIWTLPYNSLGGSSEFGCDRNCDLAASPSDVTVTKT